METHGLIVDLMGRMGHEAVAQLQLSIPALFCWVFVAGLK
jgi:hypothetical protein